MIFSEFAIETTASDLSLLNFIFIILSISFNSKGLVQSKSTNKSILFPELFS